LDTQSVAPDTSNLRSSQFGTVVQVLVQADLLT
jgi:hypothetical protein